VDGNHEVVSDFNTDALQIVLITMLWFKQSSERVAGS